MASAAFPLTSVEFCQSAESSVLENTTLRMPFILPATAGSPSSAAGVGQ